MIAVLVAWVALSLVVGVLIGRFIRLADARSADCRGHASLTTADLPPGFLAAPEPTTR